MYDVKGQMFYVAAYLEITNTFDMINLISDVF